VSIAVSFLVPWLLPDFHQDINWSNYWKYGLVLIGGAIILWLFFVK
jgi:hypothetical protein